METKPGELWLAVRELYRWRKSYNTRSTSYGVFDRLSRSEDVPRIELIYPYYKMAYDMWVRHKCEDTFFSLHELEPTGTDE